MVVLWRHEHVGIERFNLLRPSLRMPVAVLAESRWHGLVEQREAVVGDVDQFEGGVLPLFRQAINPARDGLVETTGACTSGHNCDPEHLILTFAGSRFVTSRATPAGWPEPAG